MSELIPIISKKSVELNADQFRQVALCNMKHRPDQDCSIKINDVVKVHPKFYGTVLGSYWCPYTGNWVIKLFVHDNENGHWFVEEIEETGLIKVFKKEP